MARAALIKEMKEAVRQEVWIHATSSGTLTIRTVTVPHPKKELGIGLVAAVRKQVGLKIAPVRK